MTEPTRFETRLTDAVDRYADRAPIDVDPIALTQRLAGGRATSGAGRRWSAVVGRQPALVLLVAVVVVSIASLAVFGGQVLQTRPAVVATPAPGSASPTVTPSPSQPSDRGATTGSTGGVAMVVGGSATGERAR